MLPANLLMGTQLCNEFNTCLGKMIKSLDAALTEIPIEVSLCDYSGMSTVSKLFHHRVLTDIKQFIPLTIIILITLKIVTIHNFNEH